MVELEGAPHAEQPVLVSEVPGPHTLREVWPLDPLICSVHATSYHVYCCNVYCFLC